MSALSQGRNPGPESSLMKNLGADLGQRITELMVEAAGGGVLSDGPAGVGAITPDAPNRSVVAFSRYFNLRASSIAGGTNEVQKNIVAKLVLGL